MNMNEYTMYEVIKIINRPMQSIGEIERFVCASSWSETLEYICNLQSTIDCLARDLLERLES